MKTTTRIFALAAAIVGFTSISHSQATANATATATIVTPISITRVAHMNFGNIAVQTGASGTVILSPAGGRTPSVGLTLPATTGTVAAASFTVTGESGYAYNVTLPSSALTLTGNPSGTMTATAFTSNSTGTLTGGTQTLNVGATLNVGTSQAAGVYTSASFDVTVNYN